MESELKARARRIWEEIFPAGDAEALAAVIAPESIDHQARPDEPQGLEGAIRTMHWLRRVFSDQRWEIRNVISEGDAVVVYATHRARHTGELMGIPPTGRDVAYDYVHIVRFKDGKVVEHWGVRDDMTLMRQLGVLSEPDAPVVAASR
ncbi:MAG: ester cyclase [Chloroflexi bacterium]|nr:MAG: ester cyclase [Chloroflexota bacterium]